MMGMNYVIFPGMQDFQNTACLGLVAEDHHQILPSFGREREREKEIKKLK
jgi:hypothetical protein